MRYIFPMNELPTTFQVDGAAIRVRRMELGMTQGMCARAAHISRSYLTEIEAGRKRAMRPHTYAALRTALRIPAGDPQLLTPQHGKDTSDGHQGPSPQRQHPH